MLCLSFGSASLHIDRDASSTQECGSQVGPILNGTSEPAYIYNERLKLCLFIIESLPYLSAKMSDNIEATPRTRSHTLQEIDLKGQVADEGYELFEEGAEAHPALTPESSAAVRLKIDLHLLPLMCILYGLNYVDKVAMGWAVLFNFRDDLSLVGDQYSWASSMFYFGYLAAQYPANYLLQRYKTARILSFAVISWGVLMLA